MICSSQSQSSFVHVNRAPMMLLPVLSLIASMARSFPGTRDPSRALPGCCVRPSASDGSLQLRLVHLRTSGDALLLGLVVQLIARAPTLTAMRPQPTSSRGGDVADR